MTDVVIETHPFRDAAEQYLSAGWPVIPIFPGKGPGAKGTPLKGTTGREGVDLTPAEVQAHIQADGQLNIGIRCPVGVVGLDVDHYDDKRGGDTLAQWEKEFGELPDTYVSTSRDDGVSGIRWFRVPEDWVGIGGAEGIELIQRHHRFALVWPSLHPRGRVYRWFDQATGLELDMVPPADALPELPPGYLDGLKNEAGVYHGTAEFNQDDIDRVLTDGEQCPAVLKAKVQYRDETAAGKAHHDMMIKVQMELLRLGEQGHEGVAEALADLHTAFTRDRGTERDTEGEWGRAFFDGLAKVLAKPTAEEDRGCCAKKKPAKVKTDDRFTDSQLAEQAAAEVMADRYIWVPGIEWMTWDGKRWTPTEEESVREAVRLWAKVRFDEVRAEKNPNDLKDWQDTVKGWLSVQNRSRLSAITDLSKGIVLVRVEDLDSNPDLLNTPEGVVHLASGQIHPHDPSLRMTAITKGSYRPGFHHPDWDQALEAVPPEIRDWFQTRSGQAATGHPVPDDMMLVFQGSGANGKTTVTSGGPVVALGDYGSTASHKLFVKGTEHSTERADLRGRRYLVAEELTEGRSIDVTALKQIIGTTRIKARYIRQDNIEFDASHTLFVTTNYVPIVAEVDHGTWRRLALVRFPYTFRGEKEELTGELDKRGDLGLRDRIRLGKDGQHDAIVTWLVEGAMRWYAESVRSLVTPERVKHDTRGWQRDADRILGLWDEMLDPDRDSAIVPAELLNVFNRWLEENGHNPWSKETFHPRFAQHSETAKHRVMKGRPLVTPPLSRPPHYLDQKNPLPARPEVYLYVKFRNSDIGQASDLHGQTGQTHLDNLREEKHMAVYVEGSDRSDQESKQTESSAVIDPFTDSVKEDE